jgi:CRP-like cAMP-binding protein
MVFATRAILHLAARRQKVASVVTPVADVSHAARADFHRVDTRSRIGVCLGPGRRYCADPAESPNSMTPDLEILARQSLLLSGAPPEVVATVLAEARVRHIDRGTTIFLQGELARAIYIVADGWVKLYRIAPSGAEAVVGVFTRGRSFGEAVAFRHDVYPVAAEAATDCTLIRIEADAILREIRSSPEVAISILSAIFAHLHALVGQIEALKAQTGAQRVAEFLLELAPCRTGACEVTLPYDKVLIAGRLGMKPESLSRAFARLKDQGVTVKANTAVIQDVAGLRDYAEEDPALAWSRGG